MYVYMYIYIYVYKYIHIYIYILDVHIPYLDVTTPTRCSGRPGHQQGPAKINWLCKATLADAPAMSHAQQPEMWLLYKVVPPQL